MAAEPLRGNCHCGRFRFELELPLPDMKNLGDLGITVCECSLCAKLGFLWLHLDSNTTETNTDTLKITRDEKSLVSYQGIQFCRNCGTVVMGEHESGPLQRQQLVNARCLWGFNPFKLGQVPLP